MKREYKELPSLPIITNIAPEEDKKTPWALILAGSIVMLLALLLWPKPAHSEGLPKSAVIDAAIGEAEGGGLKGMQCVISAINNRQSLRGVYGIKSPRVTGRLYSNRTFVLAVQAYEDCQHKDYARGATFWFSDADMKKAKVWEIIRKEHLVLVKRCAGNNFYKRGE